MQLRSRYIPSADELSQPNQSVMNDVVYAIYVGCAIYMCFHVGGFLLNGPV